MVKRWTASQQTDWPFWFGFFFSKSIQYVRKKNQFQWIVWRLSIESIIEFRNRIHKRQWKMKILTPTHPHWSQSNVCNEEWYRIDVSNHHSLMDGSLIITCDLDSNKKKKKISKINGWNKIEKSNNKITPKKKKNYNSNFVELNCRFGNFYRFFFVPFARFGKKTSLDYKFFHIRET